MVVSKTYSKALNVLQKQHRVDVAQDMLERVIKGPTFVKHIITKVNKATGE